MINQYIQAFQRKDLAAIARLFSDDMSFQDPSFGLIKGRENVLAAYKEIFKNDIVSADIFRQGRVGNTHMFEFSLVLKDPQGKKIIVQGIDLIETSPTHITSIRAYLDTSEFVQRQSSADIHA